MGLKIRRMRWEENVTFKVRWRERIIFGFGVPNRIDYMGESNLCCKGIYFEDAAWIKVDRD
jgi:hypothetical protein